MKHITIALFAMLIAVAAQVQSADKAHDTVKAKTAPAPVVTAKVKWATDAVFEVPESALYDSVRDVIYVANINGKPDVDDGNGYISKLKPDGTVENLKWATGLSAPKGMGVFGGKLYVTDITRLVEINIATGEITSRIELGATFANDIAIDSTGVVYVSDNADSRIYRVENGKAAVWLDKGVPGANGLLVQGSTLLVACNGDDVLRQVDLASHKVTDWTQLDGGLDGIMPVRGGGYLVSGWTGVAFYVAPDGISTQLFDTREDEIQSADIGFIPGRNLLLVPTFFDNRVVAYELTGLPKL